MTSSRKRLLAVSYNLLGFNAMSLCTQLQRFQRNLLSQSLQRRRPENGSVRFLQSSWTYLQLHGITFQEDRNLTENRFLYLYVYAAQTFLSFLSLKMCLVSCSKREKFFFLWCYNSLSCLLEFITQHWRRM